MQPYKNLRVTTQVRRVIKATYDFTKTLPIDERFELSSQMRRAAISIGLNIAEGASRQTTKEFVRYLEISRGSGMELDFAIVVSADLDLGAARERNSLATELEIAQKQLSALITALRQRSASGRRK
jgi:four helix bundle protein